jgi:transposase
MPKNTSHANHVSPEQEVMIVGGVDTHADTHTVAAVDQLGRKLGHATFAATRAGYGELLGWLSGHGQLGPVGIEGTGSYGAGLSRYLRRAGVTVVEVNRPARADRRRRGKSDPIDAENAARAVLAGATGTPKASDGAVEALRFIHTSRRSAVKARTAAMNAFTGLLRTCPDDVRERLAPLSTTRRIRTAAQYRPDGALTPTQAAKTALRALARRILALGLEIAAATRHLKTLTRHAGPQLLTRPGFGPETTAQLLITAGDNPERLTSPAAFAALCGTSPVPASSGRTQRHRLNRGGDRQANRALHMIALSRLRYDTRTQTYAAQARNRGKSTPDILRQLKRYLAREAFHLLNPTPPATSPTNT